MAEKSGEECQKCDLDFIDIQAGIYLSPADISGAHTVETYGKRGLKFRSDGC